MNRVVQGRGMFAVADEDEAAGDALQEPGKVLGARRSARWRRAVGWLEHCTSIRRMARRTRRGTDPAGWRRRPGAPRHLRRVLPYWAFFAAIPDKTAPLMSPLMAVTPSRTDCLDSAALAEAA